MGWTDDLRDRFWPLPLSLEIPFILFRILTRELLHHAGPFLVIPRPSGEHLGWRRKVFDELIDVRGALRLERRLWQRRTFKR